MVRRGTQDERGGLRQADRQKAALETGPLRLGISVGTLALAADPSSRRV